jgi:hypothetical protein
MPNNAVARVSWYGLSITEPAGVSAETGVSLGGSDPLTSQDPIGVPPTGPRSNYSWLKQLALEVTTPSSPATTIINGVIRLSQVVPTGVRVFWQADTTYRPQLTTPAGVLSAGAAALAVSLSTSVAFAAADLIQIDTLAGGSELRQVGAGGSTGSGPYTTPITVGLTFTHSASAPVNKTVSAGPASVASEDTGTAPNSPTIPTGPAGGLMTVLGTAPVQYDTISTVGSGNGGTAGRKGKFLDLIGAVASTFGGLPASNSLGILIVSYDEQ